MFSSGGPSVRFLTRYDGQLSEPLVGRQGSRVSMRVARGSALLLPSHGRGLWPRDVLKKVSRGLSRVEAHSRRGLVGGSTFRRTPISRSLLDKNPMPGHLSKLPPVNAVNTKGQFFSVSFGKNPRFQIQLDKRPLSPGISRPEKVLERPSSTRLEARFPSHGSGAVTRSPSPLAWRPDFPGAPREAH